MCFVPSGETHQLVIADVPKVVWQNCRSTTSIAIIVIILLILLIFMMMNYVDIHHEMKM